MHEHLTELDDWHIELTLASVAGMPAGVITLERSSVEAVLSYGTSCTILLSNGREYALAAPYSVVRKWYAGR